MLKRVVLAIFFFIFASPSYAASVWSENRVEVHSNVSSSSNSGSNSDTSSHTNITVETNGKVTHYESDQPGDVSVKSTNGESSIKVNGKDVSPTVSSSKQTSATSPTITKDQTDHDVESNGVKNKILEEFKKPFRIFLRIFGFLPFFHR